MNIIGENIRRLRKTAGFTQIEFAQQIGVSQGTLSDIEQGNCNPSVDTVLSIHSRFNVDLEWLLKGSNIASESYSVTALDLSKNEIQLIKLFNQMELKDQKALLKDATLRARNKV
jgi:transcriptional regulator with XRE-family HTH domain